MCYLFFLPAPPRKKRKNCPPSLKTTRKEKSLPMEKTPEKDTLRRKNAPKKQSQKNQKTAPYMKNTIAIHFPKPHIPVFSPSTPQILPKYPLYITALPNILPPHHHTHSPTPRPHTPTPKNTSPMKNTSQ